LSTTNPHRLLPPVGNSTIKSCGWRPISCSTAW